MSYHAVRHCCTVSSPMIPSALLAASTNFKYFSVSFCWRFARDHHRLLGYNRQRTKEAKTRQRTLSHKMEASLVVRGKHLTEKKMLLPIPKLKHLFFALVSQTTTSIAKHHLHSNNIATTAFFFLLLSRKTNAFCF